MKHSKNIFIDLSICECFKQVTFISKHCLYYTYHNLAQIFVLKLDLKRLLFTLLVKLAYRVYQMYIR